MADEHEPNEGLADEAPTVKLAAAEMAAKLNEEAKARGKYLDLPPDGIIIFGTHLLLQRAAQDEKGDPTKED